MIKKLKDENKTVIISSHIPNILLLTDKLMFLEKGNIKALGLTSNILKKVNKNSNNAKSV